MIRFWRVPVTMDEVFPYLTQMVPASVSPQVTSLDFEFPPGGMAKLPIPMALFFCAVNWSRAHCW